MNHNLFSESAQQVIDTQGWNEETVLGLVSEFMRAKEMSMEFGQFLESKATNENMAAHNARVNYTPGSWVAEPAEDGASTDNGKRMFARVVSVSGQIVANAILTRDLELIRSAPELHYWLRELFDYCPLSKKDNREAVYLREIEAVLDRVEKKT